VPPESLVRAIRLDSPSCGKPSQIRHWELPRPSRSGTPNWSGRRWVYSRHGSQERYLAELEEIERADAGLQHQHLTQLLRPSEPSAADLARIAGTEGGDRPGFSGGHH
jgi:hypothetical protein